MTRSVNTETKKARRKPIEQAVEKTKQAERARAAGREAEALALEAEVAQLSWKASSKVKVPYDVYAMHDHFAKFAKASGLWDQARRGAHADTAGKNVTASRAAKVEAIMKAGLAADESVSKIAFQVASRVTQEEAEHYLEVRNSIAKLANEARLRDLIDEAGDIERAKDLAKARKVVWAPIFATPEQDEAEEPPAEDGDEAEPDAAPDSQSRPPLPEATVGASADGAEFADFTAEGVGAS